MKVYVNIPAGEEAGGCESLYQLVDSINNCGGYASIIWDRGISNPVPNKYSHYNVRYGDQIEDDSDNWVIYPEVWTEKIHTFNNLKKAIWWLSVDNNHGKFTEWDNDEIYHIYQSFYAQNFIIERGGKNHFYINDYISKTYLENEYTIEGKENFVLYNPIKGKEFTVQIIQNNPNIKFVPIQNLNEEGIIDLLKRAKVYIDFGHHPGRDRIPRESAHLGCCVITNNRGSAGFYGDVVIPSKYKIDNIELVNEVLKTCFEDYENEIKDFQTYRDSIKTQKSLLNDSVKKHFI
jgi:hypothetical protein